ncbi:MAG: thioredoxin-disulfide reductase [Oscillospiraceae bacterium]|jgi:thioredoxin reductase (NADPH)|nr:thioredoxin-disulfide reductase [Oscillospiraceae bacterium]
MADVLIIGAGPAGLTAALYALRYGLSVTAFEKNMYGGQMSLTNSIENYPGFEKIPGTDLANHMYKQVSNLGCEFIFEKIIEVDLKGSNKCVKTAKHEFHSKSIVVANGLKRCKLNVPGENEFSGKGVSYCATCDGAFFSGKSVAVVGGGNVALEDAVFLSNICKKVYLIIRKNSFRAGQHMLDIINSKKNIEKLLESKIIKIFGDKFVNGIIIDSKGKIYNLDVNGVFIAIGYEPGNEIFYNQIGMDANGYFISNDSCETNIPGVYVAGDCRKKDLRQIITAAADGAIAGNQAVKYVSSLGSVTN